MNDPTFAKASRDLLIAPVGVLNTAPAPSGGQGLALDPKGNIPSGLVSGAMAQVFDSRLSGAAASFDISNIPSTYNHLKIVLSGRGTVASIQANIYCRFNNDSGANYDWQLDFGSAATPSSAEGLAQTQIQAGEIPGSTAPANVFSQAEFMVSNYTGTTGQKTLTGHCSGKRGTASGTLLIFSVAGFWRSTSAINRITLLLASGNFDVGSRLTLYGLS